MQTAFILIFGTKVKISSGMAVPLATILILIGLIIFQEPGRTILFSLMIEIKCREWGVFCLDHGQKGFLIMKLFKKTVFSFGLLPVRIFVVAGTSAPSK